MHDRTIPTDAKRNPPAWLIFALGIACGATVANLYYAQPLIGQIGAAFGLDLTHAGLLVTVLQAGYVLGLILLAPLGDLVENKTLILLTLGGVVLSLLIAATASTIAVFVAASLLLGVTATATQMLLPMAAHLAPAERRGQIVGTVMSGLLFGILLARPLATLIAGWFGWRAVFALSAAAMCAVVILLTLALPRRRPDNPQSYPRLIASLWQVLTTNPVLQRCATYQGLLFVAFSLFWTATPLLLEAPPFSLGHLAIAGFLLSGVAGAFVAPLAGRLADRGHGRAVTGASILGVALSFVLTWIASHVGSLTLMILAGILLDGAVQANTVAGQRAIYALRADIRSRLNALYLAIVFSGAAIGSALSGYSVATGGAPLVSLIGLGIAALVLVLFSIELIGTRGSRA